MDSRPTPQRHKRSMLSKGSQNSSASSAASSSRKAADPPAEGHCSSPTSTSSRSVAHHPAVCFEEAAVENVTVTVRFRPLSQREIRQGEEIAWYADGDTIVRSEHNPSLAYAYDRVFGPTTTTRHVYDVAAQHVVSGAMEGINGTIFAYGVTSSGKTHTMHGDQRSPGIIPLAVKDAFSIIQETPSREFLLRVSYLEIYNEVVNDLLNPAGQNLRIREDSQGTFVEGIKEEVVLSPAHALSLIAAGEEHRHIGSNNFNVLSSRSHTIFTLTIESSPSGDHSESEAVNFSQLNLIDLAGSESSRAETTGIRRKEGSYINKSLLTLGTVISKLTEGKATHIPYRDSKLTRLLQPSLSGQGRVSLICTVTPSSSISEETHNTLKFARRAKRIEIQASQNKILDERSLIKKYQNEIQHLKEELEQLRKGIITVDPLKSAGDNDDLVLLKQKLEDGHVKLQSRLEQEEEAKAALLGRIQRLTKLILVSTKAAQSSRFPQRPGLRRRHSFGEEELAYLPYRRREVTQDDENVELVAPIDGYGESTDDSSKEEKKNRKHGLLNWFKLRKKDNGTALASDNDKSSVTKSQTAPSTPQAGSTNCLIETRNSSSITSEGPANLFDLEQARDTQNDNSSEQDLTVASISDDHVDLLKEQMKILSGDVALSSSILKRLSEEASHSPRNDNIEMEMRKIDEEIKVKNRQILSLVKRIADANLATQNKSNAEMSPSYAEILEQLNEKTLELEVKTADNRVIQDQLLQKVSKCEILEETVSSLKEQLDHSLRQPCPNEENLPQRDAETELMLQEQALEIEELRQKVLQLTDSNNQLDVRNKQLAEEASYAKGLASAAGVELKALSEEVAKLMSYNERLATELATLRNANQRRPNGALRNSKRDIRRHDQMPLKRETSANLEREHQAVESALMEMERREVDLRKALEDSKRREADLEDELAGMWVLVAKLKKSNVDGE